MCLPWRALLLLVIAGTGCTKSSPSRSVSSGGAALATGQASASAAPAGSSGGAAAAQGGWVEAARLGQWEEAARLMDAVGDPRVAGQSGFRYVRARAALELGDAERAVRLLARIEAELPWLASEIARDRAAAQLEVGPYDEAARYYAQHGTALDLTRAALAWERGHEYERALGAANRAVDLAARGRDSRGIQAEARAVRARVAERLGQDRVALGDWRWLATSAPATEAARDAEQHLVRAAPLTTQERYARALEFARAGDVDRAERELASPAPGRPLAPGQAFHVRGWARYLARKDYAEAADLLEKAALAGGEQGLRDLFHSARARSRAHQDEQAIRTYLRIASRYPKSPLAEEAFYLAARLTYLLGRWDKAVQAYTTYLGRYAKTGRFREAAEHEQAVSLLAGGRRDPSVRAWRALVTAEGDARVRARYRELYAVALLGAGDRDGAREQFRRVIRDAPLSFAALVSAARLRALGEPKPIWLEPAESAASRPPLAVELPLKPRLLHEIGLDAAAEQELTHHETELRRAHGSRGDEALCEAYGLLSGAARRFNTSQRASQSGQLDHAPSASTQWLWNCAYPRPYQALVRAAEREHGLPQDLVYALMRQESAFRARAESEASAVGLMQLLPSTAERAALELGLTPDPKQLDRPPYNIRLGSFYLARLLRLFRHNLPVTLAAYNAGPLSVSHWLESGEKLPLDLFVARIPFAETRTYVHRVMGNLARYLYLDGGSGAVPEISLDLPQGMRAGPEDY
jgi:soluble lytic murein transglycosylase